MHERGEPQYEPDKDDSEQTYPCGKRLVAVASSLVRAGPAAALLPLAASALARAGPAAALSPPATLDKATPSAAAWHAMHA